MASGVVWAVVWTVVVALVEWPMAVTSSGHLTVVSEAKVGVGSIMDVVQSSDG